MFKGFNKKTIDKYLLLLIVALVLVSCDKIGNYVSKIENNLFINESSTEKINEVATDIDVNESKVNTEEEVEPIYNYEEKLLPSPDFKKVGTREKKDVICFVGDVYMSRRPREAYEEKGVDGIVDKGYQKIINESDFVVGNLECSVTDNTEEVADKTFTFALPTKYVKALKEVGINLFTMANNHVLDYGINAMINTMKVLDEDGIYHIGTGRDLNEAKEVYIKEIDGKRYAFLGASGVLASDDWKAKDDRAGVFSGYEIDNLCKEIKIVKPYVDKVIVYMHWGRELQEVSSDWQRGYGRRMVDAGADLVVGAHPHITQDLEYYKGVPIVYSLGNFIYGGTMRETMVVTATFDYSENENGNLLLTVYPGISNYNQVKKYWKKEDIVTWLEKLERISNNCFITDEGQVFALDQVVEQLRNMQSEEKSN